MPGQAAFSSTPAAARGPRTEESFATQNSDDPSWMTSVESPLVRLDREFKEFSRESERDGSYAGSSTSRQIPSLRFDEPTPSAGQQAPDILGKGKKKEAEQPLLRNVLRHNLHSIDQNATNAPNVSPLKFHRKPKTPLSTMKHYNPYLPPDTDPVNWSGVVDLRDPSVTTPQSRKGKSSRQTPASYAKVSDDDDDDDSFEGLPPGMSPPVTMSPARPPRSSAELGLLRVGQTPKAEVPERIKRDLLRDMQYSRGIESSMSTVPTPPSLSRYNRPGMDTTDSIVIDSSLESMFRRVGLDIPLGKGSTPGLRLPPRASQKAVMEPSEPPQQTLNTPLDEPMTPVPPPPEPQVDSDSDSLDEINNTAHPSAAFLMASTQRNRDSDDSFGSSNHSSDSLNDEDGNGLVPVHPFAQGIQDDGYDDDDSYDDDMYDGGPVEEETLFGVPPAQRLRAQSGMLGDDLRILGDLVEGTLGKGSSRGGVEESPTPAPQN